MCIFCKIVAGEIPANKVLENEDFLAFHDINPIAPIHILIIPKAHIENFQSLPAETMAKMTPFIQEVARELCLHETGYRLVTNNGKDGGHARAGAVSRAFGHIGFWQRPILRIWLLPPSGG